MTIERAKRLTFEEYASLDEAYEGFNKETYNNHQTHSSKETFYDFLEKGSEGIKGIKLLENVD